MKYSDLKKLLSEIKIANPKILVVGDVMLDHYVYGDVNRISPEAPVPIINYEKGKEVLGGAGNVVHNLVNLGAKVNIATIIGDDLDGRTIRDLFNNINKTRVLSGGIQLLRMDHDSRGFLKSDFIIFKKDLIKKINQFNCVVISDYNKGVCSKSLIQDTIYEANKYGIPVLVDPKGTNWDKYMNATALTPNKKEVEDQLNLKLKNDSDFENAAKQIKEKFKLEFCLITRGADGMTFYGENNVIHQKVGKKEVFDVSGAGDTVIACLAASLTSGITMEDSIQVSSFISSEVVTHTGTVPFDIKRFMLNG
jgi:D-beta-D-heptose 7-phosphate kinase/D-beta-D-heptose 1-phosphate adenosyltransferase